MITAFQGCFESDFQTDLFCLRSDGAHWGFGGGLCCGKMPASSPAKKTREKRGCHGANEKQCCVKYKENNIQYLSRSCS